jgi:hypothetical protein
MKKFLCYCLCVLLGSASLSAQITVYLQYPTDSIAVINPLQDLPAAMMVDVTFTQPLRGVVTLLPDGTLQYVANSMTDVAYGDWFSFTVEHNYTYQQQVFITPVLPQPVPNVPPHEQTFAINLCGDVIQPAISLLFGSYNSDLNNDSLFFFISENPAHGSASVVSSTANAVVISYVPEAGFVGSDQLRYQACEASTLEHYCVENTITLIVKDCTSAVIAAFPDGGYVVDSNSITIPIIANDVADNMPVTVHLLSDPKWGTVALNADNTLTYTPNLFVPSLFESIWYQICDSQGNCSDSTTIDIWYSNYVVSDYSPVMETYNTYPNHSININLFENDMGNTTGAYVHTITQAPSLGELVLQSDGTYSYTPFADIAPLPNNMLGDYFEHIDCNESGICGLSSTSINILSTTANDIVELIPFQGNILLNIVPTNNLTNAYIAQILSPPYLGTAYITNNEQSIFYAANDLASGMDVFSYVLCDGANNCDTANIYITIPSPNTDINTPPPVWIGYNSFCKDLPSPYTFAIPIGNDAAETYSVSVLQGLHYGTISFDNNIAMYSPSFETLISASQTLTDTLYYRICETNTPELYCSEGKFILQIGNCTDQSPTALDLYLSFNTYSYPSAEFYISVYDDSYQLHTFTQLDEPLYGTLSLSPEGFVSYTINDNAPDNVVDAIRYIVCNSSGNCDTGLLVVDIIEYHCCNLGAGDFYYVPAGVTTTLDVLDNDAHNTFITGIVGTIQYATVDFTDSTILYTPYANLDGYNGTFGYIVCHTSGFCDTIAVGIGVQGPWDPGVNNPPHQQDYDYLMCEEQDDHFIAFNFFDASNPNDSLSIELLESPQHGIIESLTLSGISYIPDSAYLGYDEIRYRVCETNTPELYCRDLVLQIEMRDCTPDVIAAPNYFSINGTSATTIPLDLLSNDHIEHNEGLILTIDSLPRMGTITIYPDNSVAYHYNGNTINGIDLGYNDVFRYTICDVNGLCSSAFVFINVLELLVPQGEDDFYMIARDSVGTFDILENDGADVSLIAIADTPLNGTVTINADNTVTYLPNAGFVGSDRFTYLIIAPFSSWAMREVRVAVYHPSDNYLPSTIAHDDYFVISGIEPYIHVLQNDIFIASNFGRPKTFEIVTPPTNGYAETSFDNTILYIGNSMFETDSLQYVICSYTGDLQAPNPTIMCDTATVYILPHCDNICLYPGDVNNDQTVNTLDFLTFGMAPATTGSPRPNASNMWMGQEVTPWDEYFTYQPFGETLLMNQSLADCNGDGTITLSDASLIQQHYGKSHFQNNNPLLVPVPMFPREDAPLIRLDLPVAADTVGHYFADIYLATEEQAAQDMYGIGFSLQFPAEQIPLDSVQFYIADSWLGNANDLEAMMHLDDGEAHIALSRHDGQGRAGYGKIGTLSYYVNSTDLPTPPDQSLNFSIDETYYSTNAGTVDLLRHETTSQLLIAIGIAPSPAPHAPVATQLRVYPNPTRELLNIVVAPDQQIQSIMLTDMAGRRLFSPTLSPTVGNRAAVSVQHLPEGMYLVEVRTDVGVGVQRVLVK